MKNTADSQGDALALEIARLNERAERLRTQRKALERDTLRLYVRTYKALLRQIRREEALFFERAEVKAEEIAAEIGRYCGARGIDEATVSHLVRLVDSFVAK